MLTEKQNTTFSKFLSLVLRHQPGLISLELDGQGWANVDELLQKANAHGKALTRDSLQYIVDTNSKKRFAFSDDGRKIRASQGHSIEVELGYEPQMPPEILYHGTAEKNMESIIKTGLIKRNRQHVHLSIDTETATKVGQRHGKPVIFEVLAQQMQQQGFTFYLSENKVWLTDHVPAGYLRLLQS